MLKNTSPMMRNEILFQFNKVLGDGQFEDAWYESIFQVLPGDLTEVSN